MFLLINSEGDVLDQYEGKLTKVAHEVARTHPNVIFDGDVDIAVAMEDSERVSNPLPNVRRLPVSKAGDAESKILTPEQRLLLAIKQTGLGTIDANGRPRGIDHDAVMRMTEEEAMRRLNPWLPVVKGYSSWCEAKAYLLKENYKTGKVAKDEGKMCWNPFTNQPEKIPPSLSRGLHLMPSRYMLGYKARKLDGKTIKVRGAQDLMLEAQRMGNPYLQANEFGPAWKPLDLSGLEGFTLCSGATVDCIQSCLVLSGQNDTNVHEAESGDKFPIANNAIPKARITEALLAEPVAFMKLLRAAIAWHRDDCICKKFKCFVRLNVLSDIPWEVIYPEIFRGWGRDVTFYDYTKVPGREPQDIPLDHNDRPYHLTFSYGGGEKAKSRAEYELSRGRAVAVVFFFGKENKRWMQSVGGVRGAQSFSERPEFRDLEFGGHRVYDGDCHDLRPLDPSQARIIGLKYKPPARRMDQRMRPENTEFLVQVESTDIPGLFTVPATPRLLGAEHYAD